MGEHNLHQTETEDTQKSSLKGTLISVFFYWFFHYFHVV